MLSLYVAVQIERAAKQKKIIKNLRHTIGGFIISLYFCREEIKTEEKMEMNTTLTIENIYNMLSSLSVSNKKWLADHLYKDIANVQFRRRRGASSDEELEAELKDFPVLDMNDYEPLTNEDYKELVHSRPVPPNIEKWL